MKKTWLIAMGMAAMLTTPATALELPKGAKRVADSEAGSIFINRKLRLTIYNTKTGKQIGGGTLHHRADGVKALDIKINGKRIKRNLKWSMNHDRFCADSLSSGKRECCTGGTLYKLGSTCYNSRNGKMVGTKFKC